MPGLLAPEDVLSISHLNGLLHIVAYSLTVAWGRDINSNAAPSQPKDVGA
jgi:hypothetical protein